jgi:N-acyl-D-aspartate/D-glutamate deacylase
MLDLKIVNGTIVDGTGQPRMRGDVGIRDGRIVAIGQVVERARDTVDARGHIVAPGFIDSHTHYDAQAFWDPKLSPSCFHGVTTVFGGFCGFSIAPMTAQAAEYIRPMLARVEGMPLATLESSVPWNTWSSFGEFLGRLEGNIGLNAGFFCGHSALRCIAMGTRAIGHRATTREVEAMQSLLRASIEEGALGFSSTISPTHTDGDGNPVPSRWADYSELLALARIVRDYPGTGLELLPDLEFPPEVVELLADFSLAGNRPVNWNALAVNGDPHSSAKRARTALDVTDKARARGAEVIALTIPCTPNLFMNLRGGFGFDSNPGVWREVFKLPLDERIAKFKDPVFRKSMAQDAARVPPESALRMIADLANYYVASAVHDRNKQYEGKVLRDLARERGCDAIDVMLDIAIDEDLRTTFAPLCTTEDRESYELRGALWRDDRTLIGASDSGAHLDMIDTFAFSTTVLQKGVREHGVISLEEAVHRLTDRIARYFGLIDRGRVALGYSADLVIFDENTAGLGKPYMRFDVPGNEGRIYADAIGVPHVFVNGVQIIADGQHTGVLPGKILRSGRDTRTVDMDALQTRKAS